MMRLVCSAGWLDMILSVDGVEVQGFLKMPFRGPKVIHIDVDTLLKST